MSDKWALTIVVSIFNWKGDISNCCCHRTTKVNEHQMNVEERVLEKRFHTVVTVDV